MLKFSNQDSTSKTWSSAVKLSFLLAFANAQNLCDDVCFATDLDGQLSSQRREVSFDELSENPINSVVWSYNNRGSARPLFSVQFAADAWESEVIGEFGGTSGSAQLDDGDSIVAMTTYGNEQIEMMEFLTKNGQEYTVGYSNNLSDDEEYVHDFDGGCMLGAFGAFKDDEIYRIGFYYEEAVVEVVPEEPTEYEAPVEPVEPEVESPEPTDNEEDVEPQIQETQPILTDSDEVPTGEVDLMQYIIIGAAAGACLLISTLLCLVIRCLRKGSDEVEHNPEVSVEHHDTEMSNRQADHKPVSALQDTHENENDGGQNMQIKIDKDKSPENPDVIQAM